jgi:type III secretory pathway lipoprotein EscJ
MNRKQLFLSVLILALAGCKDVEIPVSDPGEDDTPILIAAYGVRVSRIYDKETGISCYVTDSGGISCIRATPEK